MEIEDGYDARERAAFVELCRALLAEGATMVRYNAMEAHFEPHSRAAPTARPLVSEPEQPLPMPSRSQLRSYAVVAVRNHPDGIQAGLDALGDDERSALDPDDVQALLDEELIPGA